LEEVEEKEAIFLGTGSLDPVGTHPLVDNSPEAPNMVDGGGGGKGGSPLVKWLLRSTGNNGPLIEGAKSWSTTLLSAGRDESGTREL
jgi:hypothetical protein